MGCLGHSSVPVYDDNNNKKEEEEPQNNNIDQQETVKKEEEIKEQEEGKKKEPVINDEQSGSEVRSHNKTIPEDPGHYLEIPVNVKKGKYLFLKKQI